MRDGKTYSTNRYFSFRKAAPDTDENGRSPGPRVDPKKYRADRELYCDVITAAYRDPDRDSVQEGSHMIVHRTSIDT
jgi:hypothetical protein